MVEKKLLLAVVLLAGLGVAAFAADGRARPVLAVLPFTGGYAGDGEAVAAMLSSRVAGSQGFAVIRPDEAADAAAAGLSLRRSAFPDSDALAEAGRIAGADYVVSGHLRRAGNRNLVVAAVICVATLELVGGYHRRYRSSAELRLLVPAMSRRLLAVILARPPPEGRPVLAVSPFDMFAGNRAASPGGDAETLAQVLAIELAGTGRYTVMPRPDLMGAALAQWEFRTAAGPDDDALQRLVYRLLEIIHGPVNRRDERGGAVYSGLAAGADLVLSVETFAASAGGSLAARIFSTDDGRLVSWADADYGFLGEGAEMMGALALLLADPGASEEIPALGRRRRRELVFGDPARFWSIGVFAGTSFPADPRVIGTVAVTLAPLPFSFLRLGCDVGFLTHIAGAQYMAVYPFAHYAFFVPTGWGGVFAGAGGGFLMAEYRFDGVADTRRIPLADFTAGVSFRGTVEVSYTLRTDFASANGKVSVGLTHRFGPWRR